MSQRHGGRTRPSRTIPSTSISPQFIRAALLLLAAIALVGLVVFGVTRCVSGSAASTGQDASASSAVDTVAARVSFVAVGDNLPNDVIGEYADSQAGSKGDGSYDYRFLFTQVKPIVSSVDLAYVDQETHIGGDDIGPKGYPSFNTTDEMADAVVDAGFDMVASATNHAYDWGYYGALEHSLDVWSKLPVAYAGTAASAEAAEKVAVVERSGIRFALLSYTYGLNGYQEGEIEDYYVNYIDKGKISADVARAKGVADVVLVAMHWGTEDESNPDAMEQEYAQFLADVGVDVVLGSHPHIIQPMTWLSGKDGNRTLVCYSLGNFVMQYEDPTPHQNLEG
ncbi:MAG: CapA family protein, partial [Eggerthellaceae bacterium]|nr:CapA family protein [Eggerthellaceae bacterium]